MHNTEHLQAIIDSYDNLSNEVNIAANTDLINKAQLQLNNLKNFVNSSQETVNKGKHKGKLYYQSNQDASHGDKTVVLCTESTLHGASFSGVCVMSNGRNKVGEYSNHWTSYMFDTEIVNLFDLYVINMVLANYSTQS